jgi:hypothetical protein
MLSRMNDCVPLGRTGYPFAFEMNVEAGRKMCRTDSALHLLSAPKVDGNGRDRSRAAKRNEQLGALNTSYDSLSVSRGL